MLLKYGCRYILYFNNFELLKLNICKFYEINYGFLIYFNNLLIFIEDSKVMDNKLIYNLRLKIF